MLRLRVVWNRGATRGFDMRTVVRISASAERSARRDPRHRASNALATSET